MKEVFVLGAGASAASANTPLGKDLVWNYHIDCHLMVPIENGIPDLTEENEDFSNFSKFLDLAASIYPKFKSLPKKWANRGEEVFYLYSSVEKKHYIDEMLETLQRQENTKDAELIRRLIFEHIVESSIGSRNDLYLGFIRRILKNRLPQDVAIISLNFDYMLHEDWKSNVYFDYILEFDWVDANRNRIYARRDPIKLIKLNGSLDWGICPTCNRLHLYFPNMFRDFYDNKYCTGECDGTIQPFIVIPHEKYGEKIDSLWGAAKNELLEANKVTIIGYSFPEYDNRIIDLFRSSIGANVKLEVINHCEGEEDRDRKTTAIKKKYNHLFPILKKEIDICLDGFRGYTDQHSE